jgi:alanine-glyoxylate transaminase / serine-glyoxylate transaminase / serine-pyruvate transaminase
MRNLLQGIEEILLMGPGPSCVPPEVYWALSQKTLGHLDPYFLEIMEDLKVMLRQVMNTVNELTLPLSGTGSAGMEAAFVNLIEPGDRVLILLNGVFGMRMQDVAGRLGAQVEILEFPWGTPVEVEAVEEKLKGGDYRLVAVVHAETSTGVRNPVAEIGRLLNGRETLYLVDTVTSLGGLEVRMDDWNIDALYSGTQKCLSCPPGLAPLSFSEKAMAKLKARKTKVPNWYLDLTMIANYWGQNRVYHHTAPVNMLYGLYQALMLILKEGPEKVFKRHQQSHKALVAGLEGLGLKMLVEEPFRLPMLNAVCVPEGVEELSVRQRLRSKYKIEIGGGLGPLAGKIWRIGLMGHTARKENVDRLVKALGKVLKRPV